jgi:uncharacterized lipoprotein YddW (UPF0748 family)
MEVIPFLRIMLNSNKILRFSAALLVLIIAQGAAQSLAAADAASDGRGRGIPDVEREFRGLWVATVDNVDWPSRPNLTTREQQAELTVILDRAVRLRMNVVILQVRPCCDALYDSKIEPWSEYLTGQMGSAPKPYYDPLAFAVEEAHKLGLELHAWFNPYRARIRDSKSPVSRNHVTITHPGLVRTYGKYLWLDPTQPATREYSLSVIMDVVRRYDIDGVHFDDYFYPYKETASPKSKVEMDFPDDVSWGHYQKTGGKMSRNDWRRENVTLFVRAVYEAIKREKPWVKFGIAPFGIWQPKHPEGIAGLNSYDVLYSDSRRWLADGWVDYLAPQLYWPIAQKAQSFPALLNWWEEQNIQHRLLCPGIKVDGWKGIDNDARELTNEILTTRRQSGAAGDILWHSKPLLANHGGVADALRKGVYGEPALVPACPWLEKESPARPVLTFRESGRESKLIWKETSGPVWQWVVRRKEGNHWTTEILPGGQTKEIVTETTRGAPPEIIAVSAVSRCGNMSEPAVFNTGHLEK